MYIIKVGERGVCGGDVCEDVVELLFCRCGWWSVKNVVIRML